MRSNQGFTQWVKKSLVSCVGIALSLAATSVSAANTWMNTMEIASLHSQTDGGFLIQGPAGIAPACNAGNLFSVKAGQNGQTAEGVKTALALALTAFAMGKPVTFLYDNGNSTCYVNVVAAGL
jgi:hypothetical protein